MKEIQLTQNKVTIVDDEDYERVAIKSWQAVCTAGLWYGRESTGIHKILLHRFILGVSDRKIHIDHINGNGLDCRRENMSLCTSSQNQCNRGKQKNNTSGYKGVCFNKVERKWQVNIMINKKSKAVGYFTDILEAARAYNEAAIKYHGKFARLNKIPD